jgi:hypothetical protein
VFARFYDPLILRVGERAVEGSAVHSFGKTEPNAPHNLAWAEPARRIHQKT